uniref:DUF834 domain-containing protein n=1 Tax=Oryza rufipogon TaxID=4529 RepID=A0A0E0PL31_ORYRU
MAGDGDCRQRRRQQQLAATPAGDGDWLRRQWQMAVGEGTVVTMAAAGGGTVVATMPEVGGGMAASGG